MAIWEGEEITIVDWLLCLFCSAIGLIVGLIALGRGHATRGGTMVIASLVSWTVWTVILFIWHRAA